MSTPTEPLTPEQMLDVVSAYLDDVENAAFENETEECDAARSQLLAYVRGKLDASYHRGRADERERCALLISLRSGIPLAQNERPGSRDNA